jgi:tetratricopeptide (TPR) repeat protein
MTRIFFCALTAVTALSATNPSDAQEVEKNAARVEFVEVRPYGDKKYDDDRGSTGAIFRKLRRIRAAEGNAAAAARLPAAWRTYHQLRIDAKSSPESAFDSWGFWAWHEAQYDTGKDDEEWALFLYRSIYDIAKTDNKFDWVTHVRTNLISSYSDLCMWAEVRALSNEAEDYFARIGFDLDPEKLPAKGAWDPMIPFVQKRGFPMIVPNSRHVVAWQRREEKNPENPTYMDNMLVALVRQLGEEDRQMGRWDRAFQRSLWVREWSDAVKNYDATQKNASKLHRDHDDAYREATADQVYNLLNLGFSEKAMALIDDGIARKGSSKKDMIAHTFLEITKESLLAGSGKNNATVITTMDEAIAREGKFPSIGLGQMDLARYVKADCLVRMDRLDEAEALLRSICERKARKVKGWLDAELELVDLLLHKRDLANAGRILRELMELVRIKGVKVDELNLYYRYVDWAMLSGNWTEALRAQREVMRLLESFRMTPLIPLNQAKLSRIMAELGNLTESDRLAALAQSDLAGRDERYVKMIEEKLKERSRAVVNSSKSKVMVQPTRVVSASLENFPARAVVSLVNHGSREAKGTLKVTGLPAKISWNQESGFGVVEVSDTPGGTLEQVSGEIRIEAGAVVIFSCTGKLANEISKTVFLEWNDQGQGAGRCEWMIEAADKESEGAVIDAAEYGDDPFFLIPVYHHLQSKGKGPVNLRVVTSQPCRVELYDAQGALQMVDVEGNGSLKNSGDWLGMDRDRNLAADLLPDEASGETRFMLQLDPMTWKGGEPLRIRVEWLVDGKWFLAAEDQIVFQK